jgi:hypothetical protein
MKTRLQRWYWSSIRPDGLPLEYAGDPLEKTAGHFVAAQTVLPLKVSH